jgi:hypothetical protein
MGEQEQGRCQVCEKEGIVERTYFYYGIKCECHSPEHFEIRWNCKECTPKEPTSTEIYIKPTKNR